MDTLNNPLMRALTGGTVRPAVATPRPKEQTKEQAPQRGRRAVLNFIPDSEMLTQMIAQARQALAKGIFWDRGSIINIVL